MSRQIQSIIIESTNKSKVVWGWGGQGGVTGNMHTGPPRDKDSVLYLDCGDGNTCGLASAASHSKETSFCLNDCLFSVPLCLYKLCFTSYFDFFWPDSLKLLLCFYMFSTLGIYPAPTLGYFPLCLPVPCAGFIVAIKNWEGKSKWVAE